MKQLAITSSLNILSAMLHQHYDSNWEAWAATRAKKNSRTPRSAPGCCLWGSFINVLGGAPGSARAELTWVQRLYFT